MCLLLTILCMLIAASPVAAFYDGLDTETRIVLGKQKTGGSTFWSSVHKYGKNATVVGGAEDIWDCPDATAAGNVLYPHTDDAKTIYVSSDHEDDADLAIEIQGLDENWGQKSVSTTLGAAAASGTVNQQVGDASSWTRVFRAFNASATAYTGNIYIHTDDTIGTDGLPDLPLTQLKACIRPGEGQTQMAIYTVPLGFNALVVGSMYGINPGTGVAAKAADVHLVIRLSGEAWRIQDHVGVQTTGTGQVVRKYHVPLRFPEKTDIKIRSDQPSASSEIAGSFGIWLVPNSAFAPE
jgi:hypothetical protein